MKQIYFSIFLILILFGGCKKEPGIGGDASIRGKVYSYRYNSTFTVKLSENYLPDTYVYLIYGNNISYGTRIKTTYDGAFEFKHLYEGKYKIYTYSKDSVAIVNGKVSPPNVAVIVDVDIKHKKDVFNAGTVKVFQ